MKTQLVVIGASIAGLRTAISAASSGIATVLIEEQELAEAVRSGSAATQLLYSHAHTTKEDSWKQFCSDVTAELDRHAEDILELIEDLDLLTVIKSHAHFITDKIVEADNTRIHAEDVIIATGVHAQVPAIPGIEDIDFIDPDSLLSIKKLPTSMIILGGGVSACETAWLMARFGVNVTIVERSGTILDFLDADARERLISSFDDIGIRVLTNTAITKISQKSQITCNLAGTDSSYIRADRLCLAAGSQANTKGMDLQRAGIPVDKRGFIETDRYFRTEQDNVYAIGSVSGRIATFDAQVQESWLVLEALQGVRFSKPIIAQVMRTRPLISWVGQSSDHVLQAHSRPFFRDASECFLKVYHDSHSIAGAVCVGKHSPEIINEVTALMHPGSNGLTALTETAHLHFSSGWVFQQLRAAR